MQYNDIRKINVNDHIEKKNGLSYLSWAWAVDQLLQLDGAATWEYKEPAKFGDTLMVFCSVTAFGKTMTAQLPVMDYRNKAIINPDAFAVNTAMQRCLAKAISLHGIGLYIYAGEDLPEDDIVQAPKKVTPTAGAGESLTEDVKQWVKDQAIEVIADVEMGNVEAAHDRAGQMDNDQKVFLWTLLDSKTRSAMKKYADSLKG